MQLRKPESGSILVAGFMCLLTVARGEGVEARLRAVVGEKRALTDVIVGVAEWALRESLRVQRAGLAKWHESGRKLCRIAHLADGSEDPLLRLLGLDCHRALIRVLAFEAFRAYLASVGFRDSGLAPSRGMDMQVLGELMDDNAFDEQARIEAALPFEGDVTAFYRKASAARSALAVRGPSMSLPSELSGVLKLAGQGGAWATRHSKVGDILLTNTLQTIQDLRDIRIVMSVLLEEGDFKCILGALPSKVSRYVGPHAGFRISDGEAQTERAIMSTFARYRSPMPGYFETCLISAFAPYVPSNASVPPDCRPAVEVTVFGVALSSRQNE